MGNKKITKKYFLKDSELVSVDDDRFNQKDVVYNLRMIIENTNPPYNIALIGKWGIGKSSIINLLLDRYKKDSNNYIVQEINAWKYEKESLKNVFLKQVWQGISGKKIRNSEKIKQIYSQFVKETKEEEIDITDKLKNFFIPILQVVGIFILAMLLIIPIFIFYKNIQNMVLYNGNQDYFGWRTFLSFCKNIGTIMIFPLILSFIGIIIKQIMSRNNNKVEINIPIETTEDYESFLNEAIQNNIKNNHNKKIITVIDDLDRLSIDKIVEALDAIKAFVGFKNCIFIVPFDDSILKKALDKNRTIKLDGNHQIVESELILDKLFQYKIYIPPLLDFDIKEYAVNLVKENIPDFIEEYCSIDTFEKVIRKVLIHKNVTTPRQVKKLINTFVNNKILITNRTKNGKIDKKVLNTEEADLQLAKISVLQADFNDFYDVLFRNFDYINRIIDYHEGNHKIDDIDEDLKMFFEQKDDKENENCAEIKREYEPLINFLKQTERYQVENIAPFMYLIQDDISIKTGDENNRRMISAMESKNEKTVRKMIEENSNIIDSIIYELDNAEDVDLVNGIITIINSFDIIKEENKAIIAENLSEKIYNLDYTKEEIDILELNIDNVFSILKLANKKEYIKELLDKYLNCAKENTDLDKNIEIINKYLEEKDNLESNIKDNFKEFISKVIENNINQINIFIEKVNIKDQKIFIEYFGNQLFNALCRYMDTSNDFSENILSKYEEYFKQLDKVNKLFDSIDDIIVLFEYNKLLEMLDKLFTNELCSNIDVNKGTEIANIIVKSKSQDKVNALDILNKINFEINDENSEDIDQYLNDNLEQEKAQELIKNILIKDKDNIQYIEETLTNITETIFKNEKYDEIFKDIVIYLDENILDTIFEKLTELSAFNTSKEYSRERQIFKYLCIKENASYITKFIEDTIIKKYKSYPSYKTYFNYTYEVVIYAKEYISDDKLEEYLKTVISAYNNYPERAILPFKLLKDEIPDNIMKLLIPKLNEHLNTSTYEDSFSILRNNRKFFCGENDNLTEYVQFLVDNIKLANSPNTVIDALDEHFSYISKIYELNRNIKDLEGFNYDKAFKFIGKSFDNKNLETVTDDINRILSDKGTIQDCLNIESKMNKYTLNDVINQNYNNLDNISNNVLLNNMIELCTIKQNDIKSATALKFIEKALQNIDDVEYITSIDQLIGKFERMYFSENKKELNEILYNCYHMTTSNVIKISMMRRSQYFKITRMFRNKMIDEEKDFYNDNVG